jgi:hypothetical protein
MAERLHLPAGMQLYRVLAACLLGAYLSLMWVVVLGWSRRAEAEMPCPAVVMAPPSAAYEPPPQPEPPPSPPSPPKVNIIDVAASAATPELIMQLVRIGHRERIAAVDDHRIFDVTAFAFLRARFAAPGSKPWRFTREVMKELAAHPEREEWHRTQVGLCGDRARPEPPTLHGPIAKGDYIDIAIEDEAASYSRRVLVMFH